LKLIRYIRIPLLAMLLFALLAALSEKYLLGEKNGLESIEKFNTVFRQKLEMTRNILENISVKLDTSAINTEQSKLQKLSFLNDLFEKNEISVLITENKQPLFWTDNIASFFSEIQLLKEGLVQLPNGWYYHIQNNSRNFTIDGLILIKYNYKIKNDYLRNRFANGFYFPRRFEILKTAEINSFPVYDSANQYAFSIRPSGTIPCKHSLLLIPVFLFLLAFFSFLFILHKINSHFIHHHPILKSILLLFLLLGVYSLMNALRIPKSLYLITLFSPQDFAFTSYWTSLGELLVFSAILFFWSFTFNRSFDLPDWIKKNRKKRQLGLIIGLLFSAIYLVFIRFMMFNLVMNSTISFALFRVEDLTITSLYGYLAVGLMLLSYLFFSVKIIQLFRKETSIVEYFVILTAIFIALFTILMVFDKTGAFRLSFFFWLIGAITFIMNRKGVLSNRLMVTVIYVLVFTLFVLFNLTRFIGLHENRVQETMALNLSEEHDPTAELFLKDIDEKLDSDSILPKIFFQHVEVVENYLAKKYFGGYFREYDLQVTLCGESDSLNVKPENITQPCLPFFNKMVEKNGTPLQGTHFYYMENTTGRITYFGWLKIITKEGRPANIFIELNSKLMSEGVGFPELLLPQNSVEDQLQNNFSFAKYNNGVLVDRGGNFTYSLSSEAYKFSGKNIFFKKWDGFDHCIYNYSNGDYIIVSRPVIGVNDYLISFPYIFVFFFLFALFLNFVSKPTFNLIKKENSLKGKIQFSIIGIVLTSLLIVGTGTIDYIITRYNAGHQKDMIDRINSVSVEMEFLLEKASFADQSDTGYLNYELMRVSDIFLTDINLYDLKGNLMATSRPEVFEKGLVAPLMDHLAFQDMNFNHSSSFIQHEHIGGLEYLSAYVPLINEDGSKIGYLNLPYFTREQEFRHEVTTFILAFINVYVFLLLASILAAYFIAARITDPLKLIRNHLKGVQLGKNPVPIQYRSDDEIGILVSEYNRKVEELANSAELLARSERESAWREMAKQIAHEIKNPLTPMKLNIQFLQRTDPKTVENYDEIMKRVTETVIEQIDNLSAIATEFSNFAKMPKAQNERFNLSARLEEIIRLYNYTGESEFVTCFEGAKKLEVYADKEQFSRAIINLFKNAIQAIPENGQGKIMIEIIDEKESALVKISDNGRGIPDELKESIFVPNFTTKTSGAGLGLAITKNIVENFKGEIWFTSEPEAGTTFYIRIPLTKG
jgi:two-component system, NtrC family, nitrogen regulation sensor histidine kinase NtrY